MAISNIYRIHRAPSGFGGEINYLCNSWAHLCRNGTHSCRACSWEWDLGEQEPPAAHPQLIPEVLGAWTSHSSGPSQSPQILERICSPQPPALPAAHTSHPVLPSSPGISEPGQEGKCTWRQSWWELCELSSWGDISAGQGLARVSFSLLGSALAEVEVSNPVLGWMLSRG